MRVAKRKGKILTMLNKPDFQPRHYLIPLFDLPPPPPHPQHPSSPLILILLLIITIPCLPPPHHLQFSPTFLPSFPGAGRFRHRRPVGPLGELRRWHLRCRRYCLHCCSALGFRGRALCPGRSSAAAAAAYAPCAHRVTRRGGGRAIAAAARASSAREANRKGCSPAAADVLARHLHTERQAEAATLLLLLKTRRWRKRDGSPVPRLKLLL